jgi:DNA repair exonuclease SbcCD ATPase subunit
VKRVAPAPAASPQRTIGEILLEHGYVTEEDLAAAVQRQEETGFPLGQILVEAGAITRLELASALAVQWADVAPARAPLEEQVGRPRSARREESDDEEDAEAPIFSYGSAAGDDAWRDEIRTAARAFAQRLDAVEQTLDELRGEAGNEPDVDVEAKFSELLGPLARHVDETARRAEAMEAAVEAVAAQSRAVGESTESIREELARRAAAATAAIEELAGRLEQRPDGAEAAEVAALRAEVAETAALRAEIAEAAALRTEVAHLRAEVTAFAATPASDEAVRDQVADLAARVDVLADPTALEDLRRALDSLADRPASDPVLAGRIQELASRLDSLADRPASDPVLAARVQELASRLDEAAEIPAGDSEVAGRVDELSAIVGRLTAVVEELRARPSTEDDGFEARVDELARRVHVLADASEAAGATEAKVDALTSQLNDVVDRLSRIQHAPDESAISALAARLDALERSSTTNGEAPAAIADATEMAQLTTQIAEATAAWEQDRAGLEKRIAELAQRVARAPAAAPAADGSAPASTDATPPNEHDLNRLWFAVERLSLQLTEHHRTLGMLMGGAGGEGQLEALAARIEILERVGGAPRPADGSPPAAGDGAAYGDVAALARRVEEVALASEASREKILTQIEQMMSSLDWRFQRLESGGQAA